jgi:hypothetical protein
MKISESVSVAINTRFQSPLDERQQKISKPYKNS